MYLLQVWQGAEHHVHTVKFYLFKLNSDSMIFFPKSVGAYVDIRVDGPVRAQYSQILNNIDWLIARLWFFWLFITHLKYGFQDCCISNFRIGKMCYTHTDRQSYKFFRDYYFEVLNDEKAKSIQEGKKNKRYQHNLIEVQCPPSMILSSYWNWS